MLADTDWHIHRLYDGLLPGATTVRATFHRYVIDANRDPEGASLYPGQNTTGLVPLTDFDGMPIWRTARSRTRPRVAERCARFHAPYHAALAAEIARVKGAPWRGDPLRLPFDPVADSVPVRRALAGFQHRHQ